MGVLQFMAWVITVIVLGITIIGVESIKYDSQKLKNENLKLKREIELLNQKEEF